METFDHVSKLRSARVKEHTSSVFLTGYATVGDGGSGLYARMAGNSAGPGVVASADGACWRLSDPFPNVLQYGAIGDGVTDCTAALQGALDWATGTGGKLLFPSGTYNFTSLSLDRASGVTLKGSGRVVLNCTSGGAGNALSARSTSRLTLCGIDLTHSSPDFSGYLLDLGHADEIGVAGTRDFRAEHCAVVSRGFCRALGVNLDQADGAVFHACKFRALTRSIDGQAGASHSRQVTFQECCFSDNSGYAINNPGTGWRLENCGFEAGTGNPNRMIFHGGQANPWRNLVLYRCSTADQTVASPDPAIRLGAGQNLTIVGGVYGGAGDTFLEANGAVSNLRVVDNHFDTFTTLFTSATPGQQAWSIGPGNFFKACPVVVANAGNIADLSTHLNIPNVSQAILVQAAGIRNNPDGTVEQWGSIDGVVSGAPNAFTFPTAFSEACLNVQLTLASPGAGTNTVSLNGDPTNLGFSYQSYGTGTNSVFWRALGC